MITSPAAPILEPEVVDVPAQPLPQPTPGTIAHTLFRVADIIEEGHIKNQLWDRNVIDSTRYCILGAIMRVQVENNGPIAPDGIWSYSSSEIEKAASFLASYTSGHAVPAGYSRSRVCEFNNSHTQEEVVSTVRDSARLAQMQGV